MDRWSGVLKVPLDVANSNRTHYRVAASLCFSSASNSLTVPTTNAVFFNGDRVQGSGNPVIERLSDLQRLAEILASKFGGSTNAWVIEASVFNGAFAVYKDFIPSVNRFGEPKLYSPIGFPASTTTISLLSNCLQEAKNAISRRYREPYCVDVPASSSPQPITILLGFSKGGTVLNQLVTELSFTEVKSIGNSQHAKEHSNGAEVRRGQETHIIPNSKETLLNSTTEVHYVDVGLNSSGAYITDHNVIGRISKRLAQGATGIRFVLHGTPRQWCDSRRVWIRKEKDRLVRLLETEAQRSGGRLQVCERFYFANREPDMQMHFEIIENMDVS